MMLHSLYYSFLPKNRFNFASAFGTKANGKSIYDKRQTNFTGYFR